MGKATLLVLQGVDQGTRFEIDQPISLGRGVRNEVRIPDTEVSRQHAVIMPPSSAEDGAESGAEGVFVIEDRGSSNGTFVNGDRITRHELRGGDRIQVGRTLLLFLEAKESPERPAADRVELQAELGARSSIVSRIERNAGDTLLRQSVDPDSRQLSRSLSNLRTLYRISEEITRPSVSLDQLLKRILDLTLDSVGADRGCILLTDLDEPGKLVPRALSYRGGADVGDRMPVSRSIVDYVVRKGQGVRTTDARQDQRFHHGESILRAGIREAMCVPVPGHSATLGVLYVDITTPEDHVLMETDPGDRFTEEQLRLLAAVGRQAALAIENTRYQTALLKAERLGAMGQTIAMLSHHIKNILQGVRGGSYLIDMGLGDHNEDLVRRGWAIVEKNQNKIYHLVMDMLTYSKERKPDFQSADLNQTVSDVCELMQARAEECKVHFECKLDESLPPVLFDPEGIHRAVLNIVINAIDAVEGGESAAVRVQTGHDQAHDTVFVIVTDNGPGIPPDQVDRIFNVFESTKGARGTGLGLAVSQKILREHGGEITVQSKPGQGCQFVLAWPRIDEEHRVEDSGTKV